MGTEHPPGAASLILPQDAEGVPVIDLGGTLANVRADAEQLRSYAGHLSRIADQLDLLAATLNGQT